MVASEVMPEQIIIVAGPTASGKTALSLTIAKERDPIRSGIGVKNARDV